MDFAKCFKEKAKTNIQRIVLAEGTEERTLKAADVVIKEGFADIIIISKPDFITKFAKENNLTYLPKATIIDPENHPKMEEYANLIYELRKSKGMDMETARKNKPHRGDTFSLLYYQLISMNLNKKNCFLFFFVQLTGFVISVAVLTVLV